MAMSASVDSDIRRLAATAANMRFSSGVGRAVIDGAVDFGAPSFTAREAVLRQIADTSLSCHHSNTDPTTLLDVKDDGGVVASTNSLRRSNHLLGVRLTGASADSGSSKEGAACINKWPP